MISNLKGERFESNIKTIPIQTIYSNVDQRFTRETLVNHRLNHFENDNDDDEDDDLFTGKDDI